MRKIGLFNRKRENPVRGTLVSKLEELKQSAPDSEAAAKLDDATKALRQALLDEGMTEREAEIAMEYSLRASVALATQFQPVYKAARRLLTVGTPADVTNAEMREAIGELAIAMTLLDMMGGVQPMAA